MSFRSFTGSTYNTCLSKCDHCFCNLRCWNMTCLDASIHKSSKWYPWTERKHRHSIVRESRDVFVSCGCVQIGWLFWWGWHDTSHWAFCYKCRGHLSWHGFLPCGQRSWSYIHVNLGFECCPVHRWNLTHDSVDMVPHPFSKYHDSILCLSPVVMASVVGVRMMDC